MQILGSTDQNELSFPKKGRMIFIEDPGHFVMNMNKRLLLQMINLVDHLQQIITKNDLILNSTPENRL